MPVDTEQTTQNVQEIVKSLRNTGIEKIAIGLGVLIVGIILVKMLMKLIDRPLQSIRKVNQTAYALTKSGLKFILYLIVVLVAANVMGIPTTSFVALFSVLALAISLAVQGILSNLAGGIILLMSHPFESGDFIEADTVQGTVKEIGFLHTKLEAPDGRRIYLPNSALQTSRVINFTVNGRRRVELFVCASYNNDPQEVRKAVMSAIEGLEMVSKDPAPEVFTEEYGDSAIKYLIHVWVKPSDYLKVKYAVNEHLYGAFKKNDVEMTYPHINVHMQ